MNKLSISEQQRFLGVFSTNPLVIGGDPKPIMQFHLHDQEGKLLLVYLVVKALSAKSLGFELQLPNAQTIALRVNPWGDKLPVDAWETVPPIWITCSPIFNSAQTEHSIWSDFTGNFRAQCMQRDTTPVVDQDLIRQLEFIEDEKDSKSTITYRQRKYHIRRIEAGNDPEDLLYIRTYQQCPVEDPTDIRFLQCMPYTTYVHLHSRFLGEKALSMLNEQVPATEGDLLRKLGQSFIGLCPQTFGIRLSPAQIVLKFLGGQKEDIPNTYTFLVNPSGKKWAIDEPRIFEFGMSLFKSARHLLAA